MTSTPPQNHRIGQLDGYPPALPTGTERRASQKAWKLGEIRDAILGYLDKADLAVMMRVDREGMRDVARKLYRRVEYEVVEKMDIASPREELYCNGIRYIDATGITYTVESLDALGFGLPDPGASPAEVEDWTDDYHLERFNAIVPNIRQLCPKLQEILFGTEYEPLGNQPSWRVIMTDEDTGVIEHTRLYGMSLADGPPATLDELGEMDSVTKPAPHGYTFKAFVDPWLYPFHEGVVDQRLVDQWTAGLCEGPVFALLGGGIRTFNLPISLDTLARLYERQTANGVTRRLILINCQNISPYNISDFERFARVALSSLGSLHLSSGAERYSDIYDEARTLIRFADLPALVTVIRNYLPNLSQLHIAVSGIEDAEAVCLPLLLPEGLDRGGNINDLTLFVADAKTPMFNIIRMLYGCLAERARVYIGEDDDPVWDWDAQMEYLDHLQQLPIERRRHLATLDFTSIGIARPSELPALTYDSGGRPRHHAERKLERFADQMAIASRSVLDTRIPACQKATSALSSASVDLGIAATSGDAAWMMDEAHAMQKKIRAVRNAALAMARELEKADEELKAYTKSLQVLAERSRAWY